MKIFFTPILALLFLASCAKAPDTFVSTREIMGTYVTITAVRGGLPEIVVRAAVADAFAEIERVDALMSTYKEDSELSEVNRMAGVAPVRVDPEVAETVERALEVARMTDGGFDPTIGPLVKLWAAGASGGAGEGRVPSAGEIEAAKGLVDFRQVDVDAEGSTVFIKRKGMSIDLGGIAKGYASDLAVASLKKSGITGGIVAVAGDLKLFGTRGDGKPWKIAVQHPRDKDAYLATVELTDAATSTSGDYERFFMKDSVRYHHIIDPRTGYPARGHISVTVIAGESVRADSLATGIFVMGPDKARAFAVSHPELDVLAVEPDAVVLATGRFAGLSIAPLDPATL